MANTRPKPVVLCILDGWGHREETDHNAIAAAHTPTWDMLHATYPYGTLNASEHEVGLPAGQMGNSEVGHMNIGAGRIVMQDLPRIDAAIADGSLKQNPGLQAFIAQLKKSGGACHLLGLLSDGGVHAHQSHLLALAETVAAQGIEVKIHAFLDGRDTAPKSAKKYLAECEQRIGKVKNISVATLCGRYYAMDRDKRWERVEKAYALLTEGKGGRANDVGEAIDASYANNLTDEFALPCALGDYAGMKDGDGLLMANFRADRARQLLTALLDPQFDGFARSHAVKFAATLGMVEYSDALNPFIAALFPPTQLTEILGEVIAKAGLTQLRIAETEKYAHVTFFLNGGREEMFSGEQRIMVPSPKVATYDLQPEMSAPEVTDKLVDAIENERFDVIIVNYANTDMVGHSGDISAAAKAVEAVDQCLARLVKAVNAKGGALVISADHGNVEQMHDAESDEPHTAHTLNLVPVILMTEKYRGQPMNLGEGRLADLAPTVLELLGLQQPAQMTGRSLIPDADNARARA